MLLRGEVSRTVDPLRNWTLPVGIAAVEDVTVAVKVREAFNVDEVIAVVLLALFTTMVCVTRGAAEYAALPA